MAKGDNYNPKVDVYINKAKPYAQPILEHIRVVVHKAIPDVEETIKWSRPFFEVKGTILANMSAFNAHCSFGFWGAEVEAILKEKELLQAGAMGSLGRITKVEDLPNDKQFVELLKTAVKFIETGQHTSPMAARHKVAKAPVVKPEAPAEFMTALKGNKAASANFKAFSPSAQREYTDWIAEAKREETRQKRIAQAVKWLAENKQRNWKYQNC